MGTLKEEFCRRKIESNNSYTATRYFLQTMTIHTLLTKTKTGTLEKIS